MHHDGLVSAPDLGLHERGALARDDEAVSLGLGVLSFAPSRRVP
jgi:hypothetical protein